MYGVVVCPRCRRAKGVRAEQRTTTCPCGHSIRVDPRRLRNVVARVTDLPAAVRDVAAAGAPAPTLRPRRPRKDLVDRVVETARVAGDRRARLLAAARALTQEMVLFTRADLERVVAPLDLGDADRCLEALQGEGRVAEVRSGYYRFLDEGSGI